MTIRIMCAIFRFDLQKIRAVYKRNSPLKMMVLVGILGSTQSLAQNSSEKPFVAFESAHVRPLAISQDSRFLYAVNTSDNRLVVYRIGDEGLQLAGEIPVGLEPVSVALRQQGNQTQAWVVNHLSDSISVVDINSAEPSLSTISRTLLVGDEPRDIVFAGADGNRAFVTTAHRGQNRPGDPALATEGIGRADVWVFDGANPGAALGGEPLAILELFGDTPRALAASPDGSRVYAAVFASGNRTTTIPAPVVSNNGGLPDAPIGSAEGAPTTGLIVKHTEGEWQDETGKNWSTFVPFSLPDYDVFEINASAAVPEELRKISGVGTVLFNMAVRPDTGAVYVSNTEAFNEVRFEPMLNGRFIENRITIVDGDKVFPVGLNPHLDLSVPTGPASEINQSLASPGDLIFSSNGKKVYVTAFSSAKVAVFDSENLESGDAGTRQLIDVGEGPSGVALDESRNRLYVMNRLDNSVSVVDLDKGEEISTLSLPFNPEPESVVAGRKFLYDARLTSGHGNVSCHSCHVFGDVDHLAWDLGNPFGEVLINPNDKANVNGSATGGLLGSGDGINSTIDSTFHPMKGPMTTQSLRGMADAGPMHWRGDKTGALTKDGEVDADGDFLDERAAFAQFNGAFVGLQGRDSELTEQQMEGFTDFALQIQYPPNPIKGLDNNDSALEAEGRDIFINDPTSFAGAFACNDCHALPVTTTGLVASAGFETTRLFKIPHLRNMYQKVGRFGAPAGMTVSRPGQITLLLPEYLGDQIRGFGFSHDGSISTIDNFLQNFTFSPFPTANNLIPDPTAPAISPDRRAALEAFLMSADTGLKPIVGQQVTLSLTTIDDPAHLARLDLLMTQSDAKNADLTVKGIWDGEPRGAVYRGQGMFAVDKSIESPLSRENVIELVRAGSALTFTAVAPGSGERIGIDRNMDGILDGDSLASESPLGAGGAGGAFSPLILLALALLLFARVSVQRMTVRV